MENKLRAYMDHLFQDVPNTKKAVEVKEEILQNIVDKYHDLVAEGKSEEAAYNIAIASIGDLDELLASLKDSSQTPNQMDSENYMAWRKKSAIRISVAIMLPSSFIFCVLHRQLLQTVCICRTPLVLVVFLFLLPSQPELLFTIP